MEGSCKQQKADKGKLPRARGLFASSASKRIGLEKLTLTRKEKNLVGRGTAWREGMKVVPGKTGGGAGRYGACE